MTDLELGRLLVALVSLLMMALACGRLFERLSMPHVVGEIVGGLVLGNAEGFAWGVLIGSFLGPFLLPLIAAIRAIQPSSRRSIAASGCMLSE